MDEKFPLGHDLHLNKSKPFVAYSERGQPLIAVEEYLQNGNGELLYTDYCILDYEPTEEEIFKVTLANPQDFRKVITGNTVTEIRRRGEGN